MSSFRNRQKQHQQKKLWNLVVVAANEISMNLNTVQFQVTVYWYNKFIWRITLLANPDKQKTHCKERPSDLAHSKLELLYLVLFLHFLVIIILYFIYLWFYILFGLMYFISLQMHHFVSLIRLSLLVHFEMRIWTFIVKCKQIHHQGMLCVF